jgi:hypothetical protein
MCRGIRKFGCLKRSYDETGIYFDTAGLCRDGGIGPD